MRIPTAIRNPGALLEQFSQLPMALEWLGLIP